MKKYDLIVFLSIYAIAFAIVLYYGISHNPVNDGVWEYYTYLDNITEGWKFRLSSVNSCVITTWLPAMVQRITGLDQMFVFRLIPALFYPLMPSFTYLIARRYVNIKCAVLSSLVVLCSAYFIYFPDIGRVGVGIAFMAGMIWALLEKKIVWALIFAVLTVFAHYATGFIAIGIVGSAWIINLIWKRQLLKQYSVIFCVLLLLTGVWHIGIARYSGDAMLSTLFQKTGMAYIPSDDGNLLSSLVDSSTREPAVQDALLMNFKEMPVPKLIEIASNYLMIIMVSLGLILTIRRKDIDRQFKIMALSFYGLIIFTVAIPWLSVYYGGMRVYFTSTMLLATCFPIGLEKIAKTIRIPMLLLGVVILIMYALSTSGIIYLPFGLEKNFPAFTILK
jgi:uncharacterized membrane protein